MKSITDEQLMAYADGALSVDDMQGIEAQLSHDQTLVERLTQLQSLNVQLMAATAEIDARPIPEAISALLEPRSAEVIPLKTKAKQSQWYLPLSLAASVLVAAMVWNLPIQNVDNPDAQTLLSQSLDTLGSGDAANGIVVLASYENAQGQWCRHYQQQADASESLACKTDSDGWQVLISIEDFPEQSYRPAGSSVDNDLTTYLAGMQRLDANQEQQRLNSGR